MAVMHKCQRERERTNREGQLFEITIIMTILVPSGPLSVVPWFSRHSMFILNIKCGQFGCCAWMCRGCRTKPVYMARFAWRQSELWPPSNDATKIPAKRDGDLVLQGLI